MNPETQTYTYSPEPMINDFIQGFRLGMRVGRAADQKLLNEILENPNAEKNKVQMTAEDFPAVFWVRNKSKEPNWTLVTAISSIIIWCGTYTRSYKELLEEGWEYSTDRKEAKGCWKYE